MPSDQTYRTYTGVSGPRITVRLSSATGSYDIAPGQTFRFRARAADSDALLVDVQAVGDAGQDVIYYDKQPSDFPAIGRFRGWFHVDDIDEDTDEFDIFVLDHVSGEGARVGAIYRAARALSPVAWDALKGYQYFGDIELQGAVELAKLRVLRTSVAVVDEAALDRRVIDYVAKLCLVESILPAAKDFWTNQLISQTALGNSTEVRTFPDRLDALEKQMDRFAKMVEAQRGEVEAIIGPVGYPGQAPELFGGGPILTPTLDDVELVVGVPCRRSAALPLGGLW